MNADKLLLVRHQFRTIYLTSSESLSLVYYHYTLQEKYGAMKNFAFFNLKNCIIANMI